MQAIEVVMLTQANIHSASLTNMNQMKFWSLLARRAWSLIMSGDISTGTNSSTHFKMNPRSWHQARRTQNFTHQSTLKCCAKAIYGMDSNRLTRKAIVETWMVWATMQAINIGVSVNRPQTILNSLIILTVVNLSMVATAAATIIARYIVAVKNKRRMSFPQ